MVLERAGGGSRRGGRCGLGGWLMVGGGELGGCRGCLACASNGHEKEAKRADRKGNRGGPKGTKNGYAKICFTMPSGWGPKPENGSGREGVVTEDVTQWMNGRRKWTQKKPLKEEPPSPA